MKTTLLAIVALCVALTGRAQEWSPFPIGSTLYYAQQRNDSIVIERVDATVPFGEPDVVILHTPLCQWWNPFLYEEIVDNLEGIFTDKPTYVGMEDSLYTLTYIFYIPFFGTVIREVPLHLELKPGEIYITSETHMKCIAQDTMTILGQLDSVRTFEYYNDNDTATIILSRHFGVISLPALITPELDPSFESGPLTLIGYSDSLIVTGYRQPQFDDYFDLHAGDLIYWYRFRHGYFGGQIVKDTTYLIDTILEVSKTALAIFYKSSRATFTLNGEYVSTEDNTASYYREGSGIHVDDMPGWFAEDTDIWESVVFRKLILDTEGSDTITTAWLRNIGDYVDDDCHTGKVTDRGGNFAYQPPIGLVYYSLYDIPGNEYRKVIGSVIDGIPRGVTELPTATHDIPIAFVEVFPNPVSDLLHINTDETTNRVEIFDLHGKLLNSKTGHSMDVSFLQPGIYFLHIGNIGERPMISRFVKN